MSPIPALVGECNENNGTTRPALRPSGGCGRIQWDLMVTNQEQTAASKRSVALRNTSGRVSRLTTR